MHSADKRRRRKDIVRIFGGKPGCPYIDLYLLVGRCIGGCLHYQKKTARTYILGLPRMLFGMSLTPGRIRQRKMQIGKQSSFHIAAQTEKTDTRAVFRPCIRFYV